MFGHNQTRERGFDGLTALAFMSALAFDV